MEARLGLSEPLRSLQVAQAGPVAEVWLSRERKGNALVRPPTPPHNPAAGATLGDLQLGGDAALLDGTVSCCGA